MRSTELEGKEFLVAGLLELVREGYDARRCGGLLVLMLLPVGWLFADSSQCEGMQTAGKAGSSCSGCLRGAGPAYGQRQGRGHAGLGRFSGVVPVMQ
ncbi:hypothetical protein EYF80_018286 [Liparis tanakae]|uniref:Uncharacterized protein n=1 Tax=Liparis tanakae TaxID=230148 RepID=A0A4Z2I2I8_9TELE|nr:hypothetical protein EYF80_018286 [Liparis tanakae]